MTYSQATESRDNRETFPVILKTDTYYFSAEGQPTLSPVTSTAPNSASSSPLSFNNCTNISSKMVAGNVQKNNFSSGDVAVMNANKNRHPVHARGPLSPQSAPTSTSIAGNWPSSMSMSTDTGSESTTPVPSVIHTQQDGDTMTRVTFSVPYFPTIHRSNSGNMSLGSAASTGNGNVIARKGNSGKVTGKKKHHPIKQKSGNSSSGQITTAGSKTGTREKANSSSSSTKKQRRLERNRLSAQLSRRRRKQYLEELEVRVVQLSLEMDSGRRDHAFQAVDRILELRQQVLTSAMTIVRSIESFESNENTNDDDYNNTIIKQLENYLQQLESGGSLSKTNSYELLVLNSFYGQQLKSFSLPSHTKFILWLTLQGDLFFRGGRATSERLSAARIGERMLSGGNDRVTPLNAMWPLVCHEVGLSYELEERVRQYQRISILQDKNTWLERHTARSSDLVMQAYQDSFGGLAQMIGRRESETIQQILTPSQRVKYLAWAYTNSTRMKKKINDIRQRDGQSLRRQEFMKINAEETNADLVHTDRYKFSTYEPNRSYHLAANLYIFNHLLQNVIKDFPYRYPPTLTPEVTKKLMRRASFESLGQQKDGDGRALSRDDSFPSSGSIISSASNSSLMKSSSFLSLGGSLSAGLEESGRSNTLNQITPQAGEHAAADMVEQIIGFVKPIMPPFPEPNISSNSICCLQMPSKEYSYSGIPNRNSASTVTMDHHDYSENQSAFPASGLVQAHVHGSRTRSHAPLLSNQQSSVHVSSTIHHNDIAMRQISLPSQANSRNVENLSQIQNIHQNYLQQEQARSFGYYPLQETNYPSITKVLSNNGSHQDNVVSSLPRPAQEVQQLPQAKTHTRKSSFLPPHLNVVPEDMFPGVEGTAADFVELEDCFMDDGDEWGIGVGLDMDAT